MAAQYDEKIRDICTLFEALQAGIATAPRHVSQSAANMIKDRFRHGEGVLAKVRPGTSLVERNTKRRMREDGDLPSDSDEDFGLLDEGAVREVRKPDQQYTDDPNRKGRIGEEAGLEYLQSLNTLVNQRRHIEPAEPHPDLRDNITVFPHQAKATALMLQAEHSRFKGEILGDLPGLGKTLPMLQTFLLGRQPGDGPALVVVPGSCQRQWMEEIRTFFKPGTVRALLLNDKAITPFDLQGYDVIVTSYTFVTSEAARLAKYDRQMADYEQGRTHIVPMRPRATLFSGIWMMDGVQFLGRFLGLDEAHTIKNHNSRVYAAIRKLRDVFEVALLATGTMLDNTWADVYSLVSLMRDHPFTSMLRMREIFTDGLEQDPRPKNLNVHVPKGVKLERLVRFLHAFTISRPSTTVTKNMEALVQCEICFDLTKEDRERSNAAFALYSQSMHNFEDAAYGGHADGGDGPQILWGEHTKAVQFTFHNSLPSFMGLKRKDEKAQQKIAADIELKDTEIVTTKERQEMEDWPVHIREGENWRSPRIDVIIDIINQSRDRRPGDSILVLDESAQFLMILEVAIEKMVDPVPVFRYTGEQEPAERHVTLTSFVESAATKTSVMLATRGAGGQGLNLQSANVVIRCGPWWKKSWEEQAVARVYRHGQKKPVWSYELKAKGCRVETYRRRVRKGKSTINEAIMALVTIEDDAPLPVWSEQLADEYEHEEFSVVELETADGSKGVRAQKVEGDDNGLIMEEAAFLVPHASGLDAKDLVGAEDMMDDEGTEVKVEKEVDSDYVYEGGDSGDDES